MYNDYELDMYAHYMDEVRLIVNTSDLPKNIKKKMCEGDCLYKKNNDLWGLRDTTERYILEFISFDNWMKREERNKKLKKLGI